ncbi:MAG: hypothetical protein IT343_21765 [Candidatus Melainabacteria bacterium]|nr:hypothetical protein [Candidatus Melainabacteria bacterium]
MKHDVYSRKALQELLCAKAASNLKHLAQQGMNPDPRLMAAVEAKLAYLQGRMPAERLKEFFEAAEIVRLKALAVLKIPVLVDKHKARIMYYAAEAAVCAASNENGPDVDDPVIEEMLERFLAAGKH